MKTDDIRSKYLNFFQSKGAKLCPSDSLVPANDPTLLFTGAGMNQFKDYFLGIGKMDFRSATSSQKCMRTGDIMNVGVTPCHHTFFEMLGNFSFGDYFKAEAIEWAWEFLTGVMQIDENRLQVSVYHTDSEAASIWQKHIGLTPEKINPLGDHDNFWPADAPKLGPNGPCGPCSEIFYDRGAEYGEDQGITGENRRWVEIWNLVFTQFDRQEDGSLLELPQKNIDTGMGLERMASCMQNTPTNMDIDIFIPIVQAVADISEKKYGANIANDVQMRRIADHARAITFCIGDGVMPGNTHRGYVLKRLLRRAAVDGRGLGIEKAFINDLVPLITNIMAGAFPELKTQTAQIKETILNEEEKFLSTLEKGLTIIDLAINKTRKEKLSTFSGADAFELYDTYGFPYELTEEVVQKAGFDVDREGFDEAMNQAKETARAGAKMKGDVFSKGPLTEVKKLTSETLFTGYDSPSLDDTRVLAIIKGEELVTSAESGDEISLVLEKTSFYGESGGQVGDTGTIVGLNNLEFSVKDTEKLDGIFIHIGTVESGQIQVEQLVSCRVDEQRRMDICRNHTATHLLHKALQEIIGPSAVQKGSFVAPDKLRFDFQHNKALTPDERRRLNELVNSYILGASEVTTTVTSQEEAKAAGATALFGEKYGDQVRMVKIGDYSTELCGGTHVSNTALIGSFGGVNHEAVGAGIRRIEAVTGHYAHRMMRRLSAILMNMSLDLKVHIDDLEDKVKTMLNTEKELKKELATLKSEVVKNSLTDITPISLKDITYATVNAGTVLGKDLTAAADTVRKQLGSSGIGVIVGADAEKVGIVVTVGKDLAPKRIKAGDIVKKIAPIVGGGGGGRPDMAQAGGKNPEKLEEMLAAVEPAISELLQ